MTSRALRVETETDHRVSIRSLALATRPTRGCSQHRTGLVEDDAQDLLHLVEVLLVADQRGSELDDRVAAVVGAAVEAFGVQLLRHEAEQDALALLGAERLLGDLVLD